MSDHDESSGQQMEIGEEWPTVLPLLLIIVMPFLSPLLFDLFLWLQRLLSEGK